MMYRKQVLKLSNGQKREFELFIEDRKNEIVEEIYLLPRDIEALTSGLTIEFTNLENAVTIKIKFINDKNS